MSGYCVPPKVIGAFDRFGNPTPGVYNLLAVNASGRVA